jgi:hypothetical protein
LKRTIREREAISSEYKDQNGRLECTANEYLGRERNEGNYRKLNHGGRGGGSKKIGHGRETDVLVF